jgi:DNA-binding GntR family transcriptional regulator
MPDERSEMAEMYAAPRMSLDDPIATTSLADEIAFRLQAAIIDGTFPAGTHLRQEEICRKFDVSRTPVREAFRKLQAQHLILLTPNRGATVRRPTRDDVREIYVMRAELEGFACELAAKSEIPGSAFRGLEQAQAMVETATANLELRPADAEHGFYFAPLILANDRFHGVIHDLAGNRRLRAILLDLKGAFPKDLVWRAMRSLNENRAFVIAEHEAVLDALRRHNGAQARELMAAHVVHSGEVLLAYLDEREFWTS